MKVSLEELNNAYCKILELRSNGYFKDDPNITIDVDRNPLTDSNYFNDSVDYVTPFKLEFIFDKSLGSKGSYILLTEVEIISEDEDFSDLDIEEDFEEYKED